MIEHISARQARAESHYTDALQVQFSDRTASNGFWNPRLAAAAATVSAMFKDWEVDARRMETRLTTPSRTQWHPPVPARRTIAPFSDDSTHGLAAGQSSGNAIQKELAQYFAQIREERIEDQRRLAGASDG